VLNINEKLLILGLSEHQNSERIRAKPEVPLCRIQCVLYCLCSFVCCVLFERDVVFCMVCVFLCVMSYCSTTASG
jgi:hypothetical protein